VRARERLSARLRALSPRERVLLFGAAAITAAVVALQLVGAIRDDLATLRARVAAHERELTEVRRAAAVLRRVPAAAPAEGGLLARVENVATGVVGRARIAEMTPAGSSDGDRLALRVTGATLVETVALLHGLESARPPLRVTRLELRKHPDDAARFDATAEVTDVGP
jgi:hypothetical protein